MTCAGQMRFEASFHTFVRPGRFFGIGGVELCPGFLPSGSGDDLRVSSRTRSPRGEGMPTPADHAIGCAPCTSVARAGRGLTVRSAA